MKIVLFIPGIIWLLLSTVLLCIPGNDLPRSSIFEIPYFDKYVHVGIFGILTGSFGFPFTRAKLKQFEVKEWIIAVALYALAFGIAMEFVQKYLVPNRSFDVVDILFDALGASMGAMITWQWYKKIGPDGNRGRNQN